MHEGIALGIGSWGPGRGQGGAGSWELGAGGGGLGLGGGAGGWGRGWVGTCVGGGVGVSVRAEGSRLDVQRTLEQSSTRRRVFPARSPGSLTVSEPREKPDSRRVSIACPRATGAAPALSDCERRRPCIDIAPRAPRAKDMPPISLRAIVCSSATTVISDNMSLQVGGRAM